MSRRQTAVPVSRIRILKLALLGTVLAGAGVFTLAQSQPARTTPPANAVADDLTIKLSGDRTLSSSPILVQEASRLMYLLDHFHYNHAAVKPADFESVIGDYMGELDNQRLFFFKTDKTKFQADYGNALYYNISNGRIESAYKIFAVYDQRVRDRTAWIFDELQKDLNLNLDEKYTLDRSKAEWPEDKAEADELWRKRIKFEVLNEVLGAKAADRATPEALQKTIATAKETVRKRYARVLYTVGGYKSDELAEIFLTDVAELYDPHSSYFSPEGYDDFSINIRLNLYGIGALLQLNKDYVCSIQELIPGGPADVGKVLKPDDKIIAVGQGNDPVVDVQGWKLRDIVQLIRGKKDTQVHLVVNPAGSADSSARKDVFITRDLVKLDNAKAHAAIFDVPAPDGKSTLPLGVISLPAFYGGEDPDGGRTSSAGDVAELIKKLQAAGIKGLVLDLRHNGGGLLSEAIDLAGLFISRGPIVQVRQTDNNVKVDEDEDPSIAYRGPLAVLTDRYSASASEIVAGALQNYGRAVVIGDSSTHGKGTVQQILEMEQFVTRAPTNFLRANPAPSDEKYGAAKITIQKFYLPNGSSTQRRGVVSDIVLPSIDEYVTQIGESDLPHALIYDTIKTASDFNGKPLDGAVLSSLLDASRQRQATLPEFKYLARNIDKFKSQQEQKEISLSLEARLKQKEEDTNFIKQMKVEREELAKNDYPYKEYRLAPATPAGLRAKVDSDEDSLFDDDERDLPYAKVDIPLRETLRVVGDAVTMAGKPAFVMSGHDPLTAVTPVVPGRN